MLIRVHEITSWLTDIFATAGCPDEEARLIAVHLVDADASGHPSHGIVRVPRYIDYINEGTVRPVCAYETLVESGTLCLIDGQYSFGQVLGHNVVARAETMCQKNGLGIIALRNAGHLGRIGGWAELLADKGLVSIHFVTVAGSRIVAPFGGKQARISTAPVAIGVPYKAEFNETQHFILDFATSRVAEGKILVSQKTGSALPADAMVDSTGADSKIPETIYGATATTDVPDPRAGKGAIQTFGQHKGSGLGLACELLAGALTGAGTNAQNRPFCNGMLSIILDPKKLNTDDQIAAEISDFITSIRQTSPRKPDQPVLIPGDPERAKRSEANRQGIELNPTIAAQLKAISNNLGVYIPDIVQA